jgi:hypothetical protein
LDGPILRSTRPARLCQPDAFTLPADTPALHLDPRRSRAVCLDHAAPGREAADGDYTMAKSDVIDAIFERIFPGRRW